MDGVGLGKASGDGLFEDGEVVQGLRMKDAGEDLLHVSVIPCGH